MAFFPTEVPSYAERHTEYGQATTYNVDVDPEIRRQIRLAAAKRDVGVRQYITDALREQLREDLGEYEERLTALTATVDPVLATLWDNDKDAVYDRL